MIYRILILALLVAPLLLATPDPCLVDTLDNYIADADGCTIGDKTFSDFVYSSVVVQGDGIAPGAGGVTVLPLNIPGSPGLLFQSVWGTGSIGSILDTTMIFNVATTDGVPRIVGATLGLLGLTDGGAVAVAEDLCLGSPWLPSCAGVEWVGHLNAISATGGIISTNWEAQHGPQSFVGVFKDIALVQTTGDGEPSKFSVITQNFSQVPEPGTFALMGLGLVGIAFWRRRRAH